MKLDDTLKGIMNQIIEEVKIKYGITFTIEEIYNIIDSQIEATKIGFIKGISIHWIKFGKFIFSNRSNRKKEIAGFINDIDDESTDLSAEQKERLKKEFIVLKGEERKKIISEEKSGNIKHSLNYIKSTENFETPSKLPILRIISKPKIDEEDE